MIGAKTGDDRVRRLLEELKLPYDIDKDGDFRIVFNIDDTRSQVVAVESETRQVDNLEIRGVWSIGLKSEAPLHADVANALLVHNGSVELGAWQLIRKEDDSCTAIFLCPIAANTTAASLRSVMHAVALAADHIEEQLTGEDDF